eukprot:1158457-Pelagomonas_calceolata.AAC.2
MSTRPPAQNSYQHKLKGAGPQTRLQKAQRQKHGRASITQHRGQGQNKIVKSMRAAAWEGKHHINV